MTPTELYQKVLENLSFPEIHPLHKAMLEECCENALEYKQNITDVDTLVYAVKLAFLTCETTLKATLKATANNFDADKITLDYRGQTFSVLKDSSFLK